MKTLIRIATRKSPLALWQAELVKESLLAYHPEVAVELHTMMTTADKMLATPLNKIGGKGLFVKELEQAILGHRADIAVHSIKDMPVELPDGLILAVICKREDPRDAFVSNQSDSIMSLPPNAVLGTSSLRRQAQALALRPDLQVIPLRGNVGSRLQKLDNGEFDAIILAAAGLKRLNLNDRIKSYFTIDEMLPAAGQGAIGIECRQVDEKVLSYLSSLDNVTTRGEIVAERAVTRQLGGSCQFPIAAHANTVADTLTVKALVSNREGTEILSVEKSGPKEFCEELGLACAEELIAMGALKLLQKVLNDNNNSDE